MDLSNPEDARKGVAEEWRIVPPYPDYEVSSLGRVRRRTAAPGTRAGKMLRPAIAKCGGYYGVGISWERMKRRFVLVHTLVAEAFIGPRPTVKHQVAHGNGIPTDNRPANLRWATSKENIADKDRHGTAQWGERNPYAKLNEEKVRAIRHRKASEGLSNDALARDYGVTPATISHVVRRATWGRVA